MTIEGTTAYVIFPRGVRVEVEVARTEADRARGLMFREHLDARAGMLFAFHVPDRYAFWMKNVRIPLDILWLDARGRIVSIVERARPCLAEPCPTYAPDAPASFVLEVVGGFVETHKIAVGESVVITLNSNSDS
jgi:uncharacterized membrane protein (UPF0127 family)